MQEKVNSFLESIGLNKNEIKAYLDLLQYRGSSALEISKRTGIHRSNTYDSIRKLIDMGFASEIIQEKKKVFIAMNPEKIKDYLKLQENEIIQTLPYLKSINSEKSQGEDEIKIEKGVFAAREAFFDMLKLNSEIDSYSVPKNSVDIFGTWFFEDFHKKRVREKIKMRVIFDEYADRIHTLNKMPSSEARSMNFDHSSPAFICICNDYVITFVIDKNYNITTIKLKNKDVADCYRNHFEILWSKAKKDKTN